MFIFVKEAALTKLHISTVLVIQACALHCCKAGCNFQYIQNFGNFWFWGDYKMSANGSWSACLLTCFCFFAEAHSVNVYFVLDLGLKWCDKFCYARQSTGFYSIPLDIFRSLAAYKRILTRSTLKNFKTQLIYLIRLH